MSTPPDDGSPKDERGEGGRRAEGAKALLTEGLRKAIQSGANALFTSEEGGKKPLGELRLPKEAMQFLYQQAERGRKDLFRTARHEMRRMASSMDMRGEIRRALVGLRVQIKAEITFTEDDTQLKVVEHSLGHSSKQRKEGGADEGDKIVAHAQASEPTGGPGASGEAIDAAGRKRRRGRPEP